MHNQISNSNRYRKIFAAFRAETQGVSGRGRTKGRFNVLQYREAEEHRRRSKLSSGFELMTESRYRQYFTEEVPQEDRLTEAEAKLAWFRDKKSGYFEQAGLHRHSLVAFTLSRVV